MSICKKSLLLIATLVFLSSSTYALVTNASNSSPVISHYVNPQVVSQYDVYMHPLGLTPGSVWNVTVSGTTYTSSSDLISLALQSGKYTFTAATRATGISWNSADNTFSVNDSNTNISVYFTQNQYIGNITVQAEPFGIAFDSYNNYTYVTNDGSNTVSVIDQSNVVIKNITVQSLPVGIAFDPHNNYIYVTNFYSGTVSVINQSNVVIKNITVQSRPVGIAFNPDNNYIYVTNCVSGSVSVIDQSNVVIKNITVGSNPARIAFNPDNNYIYVTNCLSGSVSVIDQSNVVIKNISVQSKPCGIVFDPYNNYMYVANCVSSTVSVINQSNVVIKNISVQSGPEDIAFNPYNNYMYVANSGSSTVSVINQSNVVINNITVQSVPLGIAFDPYNNYVYVTNYRSDTVSILSSTHDIIFYTVQFTESVLPTGTTWNITLSGTQYTSDGNIISIQLTPAEYTFTAATRATGFSWDNAFNTFTVNDSNTNISVYFTQNQYIANTTVQSNPIGIAFDPYNNYMYVANSGSSTVSVIDQSNVVIKNISVQCVPLGIAFDPYNNYMYVANSGSSTVSVINQSNVVIKNISVNASPFGIAFDPYSNYMYVTNAGTCTVSVINQSNVVIKNISVQSVPEGIAFDPYNNYMYIANRNSGTVSILSSTHDIIFYTVQFTESVLPTGTTWNITLSGMHYTSDGNIISIQLTPAEYTYSAMSSNISFLPVTGRFNVSNNMIVNVQFQEKKYPVTFTETGLPSGTTWYVNISGMASSGPINTTSYTENLTNGTHDYMIGTPDRIYEPSPISSTVKVNGKSQNVSITFTELTYKVTFNETGLLSGTTWYLNLTNGQSFQSATDTISFMEPNGSYHYTISSMEGRTYSSSPLNGTFQISGSSYSNSIMFSEITYQVTFTETGLSAGTEWYIAVDNSSLYASSLSNNIIDLPNGSYYITAISTGYSSNFTGTQQHAILTVSGSSYTVHLTFTKTSSVISSSSSSNDLTIVLGTAAGVIVGVASGYLLFRKKR